MEKLEFDKDKKAFKLKDKNGEVTCSIKVAILDKADDWSNTKFDLRVSDYICLPLYTPLYNSQADVVKLSYNDSTVGYVFPGMALLNNDEQKEKDDENYYKKVYKFYAIKCVLSAILKNLGSKEEIELDQIINSEISYAIIYKKQLNDYDLNNCSDEDVKLELCPCFASNGFFPVDFDFEGKYDYEGTVQRDDHFFLEKIKLKKTSLSIRQNRNLEDLYQKYLPNTQNSLSRFVLIYQIVELLVNEHRKKNFLNFKKAPLSQSEGQSLDVTKILKDLNKKTETRNIIKTIFDKGVGEKTLPGELNNYLKSINSEYNKTELGDLIYDIRNMICHDFLKLKNGGVKELETVIYKYELAIHGGLLQYIHN